ncbi:MAG TPA: host attachment protein, partial [Kofleriaceae bacterium]|nr:host attachment protein [Kofleriaceae bacterium]
AVRARVFVLDVARDAGGPPTSELVELAEITNPALRARDVEALSDSRPGLRREAPQGPRHAVSDHREDRRRELERHFAVRVAEEAAGVWRRYPSCELIVAASPRMLGFLRPAIERQIRAKDRIELHELARDLTKLSAPMLHDLLAEAQLLPGRGRRAPLIPVPGQPA